MMLCPQQQPFPTELLVSIFAFLDGTTLATCASVCKHWHSIIQHYDDLIWSECAQRDFEKHSKRRFWTLLFPDPGTQSYEDGHLHRSWQDMYRITKNWHTGNCSGYFPVTNTSTLSQHGKRSTPFAVVGIPQEHTFFTTLSITASGHIIRSNPTYRNANGEQCLLVQCPHKLTTQQLDAQPPGHMHAIVCHHTHPFSNWLVTGALDGSVALWDIARGTLFRVWSGHRGRVLCVSMNDEVVVSGGSDSMIRVWDINDDSRRNTAGWTARRGMIDISLYLSSRNDWHQGVGEIAVHGHLVACAPDASGPILIFSLLTGSLVYELRLDEPSLQEDMTAFAKLCLTPFFLLTKGKVSCHANAVYPGSRSTPSISKTAATVTSEKPTVPSGMTPYQLYQYYQTLKEPMSAMRSCINVWDLHLGKITYQLAPPLSCNYLITDIRVSPDFSKVMATIEIRRHLQIEERIYCWDFAGVRNYKNTNHCDEAEASQMSVVEIHDKNSLASDPHVSRGKSWVCFM